MFECKDHDGHETVAFRYDAPSGLKAIVAIHDSTLGPAIGGCRMRPYSSTDEALGDVLRLSKGMTYKCAISGIPYGGGKAVIIGDPRRDKSRELLVAMAGFVNELGGRYITSFDSGTTLDDLKTMGGHTAYIGGLSGHNAASSTAYGVFICIETALRHLDLAEGRLDRITVAIQGVGSVGARLARLLSEAGARLIVSDVDPEAAQRIARETGATIAPPDRIHGAEAEVYAPCALGGAINRSTLPDIRARIIAGAANNQLAEPECAGLLQQKGILYCPDYLVNAGGIVDVHYQRLGDASQDALQQHLHSLGRTLDQVLERAAREGPGTVEITDRIAEERIRRGPDSTAERPN